MRQVDRSAETDATGELAVWEFAGLMLTYWCSSRCTFCYVNAGPERGGDMDVATAVSLWRSLDRLAAAHGKTMRIHLAGGEPFRDWVRLVSIIRAARDAGLTQPEKVETNASWAIDDGLTRARLELLAALGVQRLAVSTDVFHQEFVPFDRVRRCVDTARRVFGGGRVIVRWWDFFQHPLYTRRLSRTERRQAFRAAFERHKDRLTGRAAEEVAPLLPCRPAVAFQGEICAAEVLRSKHVHIDPWGHVFPGTCSGIILGRAGDARGTVEDIWHELAANWRRHPVLDAVVDGGSYELLQRAKPLGYRELEGGYADKCHLCTHIRQFLVDRNLWSDSAGPPECYARRAGKPTGPG